MRLLIADDEDYAREGLIESIPWEKYGIDEIMQAKDGREALTISGWFRPDIVLTDIRMPKLNGLEFAERLIRQCPDSKLLFMSGYMEIEYLKKVISLDAVEFVEKPIELDKVEQAVKKYFTVRIAWVFGLNGKNFIKTMLRLGRERGAVSVVDDQIGSPTYTYDLARLLVDMIQTERYGRYHATNEGICSWYEFACEIFKQAGMDQVKVTPVDSASYPAKAKRPSNSRMSKEKLTENGFERLPDWQDALSRYLKELEKQEA